LQEAVALLAENEMNVLNDTDSASAADAASHAKALPEVAGLLIGVLPFDLPELEQRVQSFFERVENLGADVAGSESAFRLAPWFAVVGAATLAMEMARRRIMSQADYGFAWAADRRVPTLTWAPRFGDPPLPGEP
jgi:hypothetical protein